LDIGKQTIKYVIAKKQKNHGQILEFGFLPNHFEQDTDFDKLIGYLFDELKLKSKYKNIRCSYNVHGPNIGIKRHSLPKMNTKMMKDAIYWAAKKEFGLEEVESCIDSIKLGKIEQKGKEQDDLLVVGCEEALVSQKVESFLSRKLVPFKVTPVVINLWKLYQKSSVFNDTSSVALIDMGASKTTIAFVHNGILEFTRELPTGGHDLTESLTGTIFYEGKPYQFDTQEAEELKLKYGFPNDELKDRPSQKVPVTEYSVLIRPILERLGNEIQRSIDYFRESVADSSIEHIYLLGGSSQLKNLIPFLSELIEPELSLLPVNEKIYHNLFANDVEVFEERFRELAIAYNLASDYEKSLNLLPLAIQRLDRLSLFKRFSVYFVIIGFIFLGLITGYSLINVSKLKTQFQLLQLEYSKLEPIKQKYDSLQQQKIYFNNKKEIYRKELSLDNPLPFVLKVVANLFPKNMSVTNITIMDKEGKVISSNQKNKKKNETTDKIVKVKVIRLYGVCYNPRPDAGIQIADYLRNIQKTGLFQTIVVENQNYLEEHNQYKFEIVGNLK